MTEMRQRVEMCIPHNALVVFRDDDAVCPLCGVVDSHVRKSDLRKDNASKQITIEQLLTVLDQLQGQ